MLPLMLLFNAYYFLAYEQVFGPLRVYYCYCYCYSSYNLSVSYRIEAKFCVVVLLLWPDIFFILGLKQFIKVYYFTVCIMIHI